MTLLEIKAPAKVNLYLEVLGKRDDNYHSIRSIVVPLSVHDSILIDADAEGIETVLSCDDGICPRSLKSEDNLATRAARALAGKCGNGKQGALINLKKYVPAGGGLGGGSADAAGVLLGLNSLWQAGFSRSALMEIGADIGCDVPALVHGGAVTMQGRGEIIQGLEVAWDMLADFRMVLVYPYFSVSTRDIYRRYRMPLTSPEILFNDMVSALKEGDVRTVSRGLFNGLQDTVCRKYPILEMVIEALLEAGAETAMVTGSGSSVFGVVHGEDHAREVAERVKGLLGFPVWCKVAGLLPDGVTVAHGPLEA